MNGWWVSEYMEAFANGKIILTSWVVWVVVSITLHELAHGWTAIRCGDDIPLRAGHMTFNPLVHIPPMAWIMFALFGFTWGLMPVQPANFRGRYDEAKVAFAGPLMNLLLWILCVVLDAVWLKVGPGVGGALELNLHTFFYIGAMINLMGFVFNLIPIPPLDGSRIVGDFFPRFNRFWTGNAAVWAGLIFAFLLFTVVGSIAWGISRAISTLVITILARAMGADWVDWKVWN
jgi:Zn-dependent protease